MFLIFDFSETKFVYQRCVSCMECGTTTPGIGCQWQDNYTKCGPCASSEICPICTMEYNESDICVECLTCYR